MVSRCFKDPPSFQKPLLNIKWGYSKILWFIMEHIPVKHGWLIGAPIFVARKRKRISTIRNHSLCSAGSFHDLMWHCDVWDVKRGINVLVNLMKHVGISTLMALECWILVVGFLMWSLFLYFPLRKRYKTLSCSFPGENTGCAKEKEICVIFFQGGTQKTMGIGNLFGHVWN